MDHPIPIKTVKHSILFQLYSIFPRKDDLGHFLFVDELFRLHKALIEFYAHAVAIIHLRRNHIGASTPGLLYTYPVHSRKYKANSENPAGCTLCNPQQPASFHLRESVYHLYRSSLVHRTEHMLFHGNGFLPLPYISSPVPEPFHILTNHRDRFHLFQE